MQFYICNHCSIISKTSDNTTTTNTTSPTTSLRLHLLMWCGQDVIWTYMCSIGRVTNCFFVRWKQSRSPKNDVLIYEWKMAVALAITNWIVCLDTVTRWYAFNTFIDHVSPASGDHPGNWPANNYWLGSYRSLTLFKKLHQGGLTPQHTVHRC